MRRLIGAWGALLLAAGPAVAAAAPGDPVVLPPAAAGDAGTEPYATVAADDEAGLAMQLSNPVAALVSVPLQFNFDGDVGPAKDGFRVTLNAQPVIPFSLGKDWNLISRTIVPLVWQGDIFPGAGRQFGLGDTVQSLFLSPAKPKGAVWGVGPVLLVPTGTDRLLSTGKWGAGPSALALKQNGPWTVGVLANHIWSFAGDSARSNVSATLINPFVTYTTPTAFTVAFAGDLTRDWTAKRTALPLIFNAAQLTRIGGQLVSIGGGVRYYAISNPASPKGFAARFTLTLLYPR